MTMTLKEIRTYLNQRFPFIMVDGVLEIEPGKRIQAIKNAAGNEIQFLGHFPEHAITRGSSSSKQWDDVLRFSSAELQQRSAWE